MYIASISNDLKFHTWPNGQLVHTYKSSLQGCAKSMSWSKDGSWLVVVPSKGYAEIVTVRDNLKHLHSIQDIQQPTCAAFQTTTKRNIALGTTTGTVLVYDIKSKSVRKHFPRAMSTVFDVEYCVNDSFLLAGCENGDILLYNSMTCNLSAAYKVPRSKTLSTICCHSTKSNLISGGSLEGTVAVWDIHANKLTYSIQAHLGAVSDLTFSPICSDLIVTVGMDRKFAIYDMTERRCLLYNILETSATAVDFCPDGVGIAVGLYDGTMNTYDTRQLNEPLYTFKAHNNCINQLKFQKKTTESSNVDYTFSNGSTEDVPSAANNCKSNQSFDSVGNMFCGDVLPDIPEISQQAGFEMDSGDSFIDAIGLNSNNVTVNSARDTIPSVSDSAKKLRESKLNILECNLQNSPMLKSKIDDNNYFQNIEDQMSEAFSSNRVSTPNEFVPPTMAPSGTELVRVIRDVVRQEVKDVVKYEIEILQKELRHDFMDVMGHMRRYFLDLQMAMVKEFVQMENSVSRIKVDYSGDEGFGEECLIQENIKLRKELATLRELAITNSDD